MDGQKKTSYFRTSGSLSHKIHLYSNFITNGESGYLRKFVSLLKAVKA